MDVTTEAMVMSEDTTDTDADTGADTDADTDPDSEAINDAVACLGDAGERPEHVNVRLPVEHVRPAGEVLTWAYLSGEAIQAVEERTDSARAVANRLLATAERIEAEDDDAE